ncbi:MAG TPA: hypothetical protein VKU19_15630 [Bryobacteraceae bacterium]|nr:hypothetical protein [Bryobacteraceae bacterium]
MKPAHRAERIAYWALPSLLCLLVFRSGFSAWFRADDFAWLGLTARVHNVRDLLDALFLPAAQGTFRPLSERAFFMGLFSLFGLDAAPFRVVIFATQFANLALVAAIGTRLTGKRAAGFWAAVFWAVNGALVEPLGWVCVYNQVLCAFFLLLAFYFLLRSIAAAESGDTRLARRFEVLQWLTFLAGFGVQELNLVYAGLAAAYTWLCARKQFRRTLAMVPVSVLYVIAHNRLAPGAASGDYAMHFTGSIFRVLGEYWTWSVGPLFRTTPLPIPEWVVPAGIAIVTVGLLAFLVHELRSGARVAAFLAAWYLIVLAPVLPLRDHMTEYYVYIPLIGLCWLGGWGLAEAWHSGMRTKTAATALALLYVFLVLPRAVDGSRWNHALTIRVRDLVEGVASAHEQHPGKTILLEGVDTAQFWNGVLDHPYRALGIENVYLTPGSERRIDAHPDLGDVSEFVMPTASVAQGLAHGDIVIYDVTGPRLRNITAAYAAMPHDSGAPRRLDVSSPLAAPWLGPEWYAADGNHRWMPRRATLRLGTPNAAGQKLYLEGTCPTEQLRAGPVLVTVNIDGTNSPPAQIHPTDGAFELSIPLPTAVIGKPEMRVEIEINRTMRLPPDTRELGLAFGAFEVK